MSHICFEAEKNINYFKRYDEQSKAIKLSLHVEMQKLQFKLSSDLWNTEKAIASCAVKASFDSRAAIIIVFTQFGHTA